MASSHPLFLAASPSQHLAPDKDSLQLLSFQKTLFKWGLGGGKEAQHIFLVEKQVDIF